LTRLRILTLFVALIALASALTACGGSSSSSDPQDIVNEATLQGVESGQISMSLELGITGGKNGHLDVSLSGPFRGEEDAELPELDLAAKANGEIDGEKIDFDGGFALLGGNKAYITYEGVPYEVDSTTFNYVKSLAKREGGGQKSSEVTACQEAASELQVADFVENLKNAGSADVDGTSTTKVSGDLDAGGALGALTELIENPACGEQLEATGALPSVAELDKAKGTVENSVKDAHVDLYVGDDHIVRRISVQATIEPAKSSQSRGVKRVEIDFDLTLSGVNEDQTVAAPSGAKPLSALFLKLGINPIELLGILQGGGGVGGLGSLLEGIGNVGGGGGSSSGSGSNGGSGGGQQAYLDCLKEATTPVDIQNCTGLLQ
jgi:hypothetical protein